MVIYGEYLFLENFITGWLLLYLTSLISGDAAVTCRAGGKVRWLRLTAASVLCGLCGFLIFLPLPRMAAAAVRVAAGLAATGIFMGTTGIIRKTIIFICLTFLSGGAVIAFMLWRQQPAINSAGVFYINPFTYFSLVVSGAAAFGVTWVFIRILRAHRLRQRTEGEARIIIDGHEYVFDAMVDSGNSLTEPVSGRPVMIIDRKGRDSLQHDAATVCGEYGERFVLVPFRAVGIEKGLLEGIRTDRVIFGGKTFEKAVIAFYEGDFGEYRMLLNREVLDEEIT